METTFSALLAACDSPCARHAQGPTSQAVAAGTTTCQRTRYFTLPLNSDSDPRIGSHGAPATEDSCTVAGTRDWAHVSTATTSLHTCPAQPSSGAHAAYSFDSRGVLRSLSFLRADSSATRVVLPRDLSFDGAGADEDDLAADFRASVGRALIPGESPDFPPGHARAAAAAKAPSFALASSPELTPDLEVHAGCRGHVAGQVSRAVRCIPKRSRSQVILRGSEEPSLNTSSGPQLLHIQRWYGHGYGTGQQLGQGQGQEQAPMAPRPAPVARGRTSCTALAAGASGVALRGGASRGASLAEDAVHLGPVVRPPLLPPPQQQQQEQLLLPQGHGRLLGNWPVAQAEGCPPMLFPQPHASCGGDLSYYAHQLSEASIAGAEGEVDIVWGCMRAAEPESPLPLGWF